MKFRVNWPFDSGEKNRFSTWRLGRPSWISDDLAIFYLSVNPILSIKFRISWPFGSEEEVQDGFLRWRLWRPSGISDQNNFSYFSSTSRADTSY